MRIHENPLAMARPPLVPKAFQPPRDNFKANTSVATSQSQELAVSDSPSLKTAASQAHFLDGFNVDECFDVRSIPDPPSPGPRLRRRLSSPSLARSLEDVTNQATAAAANKRSRRSLCHIPSPLEQRDEETLPRPADSLDPSPQLTIEFDDTYDQASSRCKRRKKRQSMAIPRDLVKENASTLPAEEPSKAASLPSPKQAFTESMQNIRDLQSLVRGYCDLALEQRTSSRHARAIQEATGYPLANPAANEEDNPLSSTHRRTILQRLSPVIDEMDTRKAKETAHWEAETHCRVEKSKSGKYRYYSLDSNTKVSSQEYKLRYIASLDRSATHRLEQANAWKAELQESELGSMDAVIDQVTRTDVAVDVASIASANSATHGLDLRPILTMDAPVGDADPEPADSCETDKMEICDMSVSLDVGEQSFACLGMSPEVGNDGLQQTQEIVRKTVSEDDDAIEPPSEEEEEVPEEAVALEPYPEPALNGSDASPQWHSHPDEPLLPFPERDESSSDPEIANAERKLWERIDMALKDYSREVVVIMQKKKQTQDRNQRQSDMIN